MQNLSANVATALHACCRSFDINIALSMIVGVDLFNGPGYDGDGAAYPYSYPLPGPGTCSECLHMHMFVTDWAAWHIVTLHLRLNSDRLQIQHCKACV